MSETGDLKIVFVAKYDLLVFCDHVPPSPSFSVNYDVHTGDEIIAVGPGVKTRIGSRNPPARKMGGQPMLKGAKDSAEA
jgi:hypothetical protein